MRGDVPRHPYDSQGGRNEVTTATPPLHQNKPRGPKTMQTVADQFAETLAKGARLEDPADNEDLAKSVLWR